MAQIILNISDDHMARISVVVDNIWPGRTEQNPVPTKIAWAKHHIGQNFIQQVKRAERDAQEITEIEIT